MLGLFENQAWGFQIQAKGHGGLYSNSGTEDEIQPLSLEGPSYFKDFGDYEY